MILLGLNLLAGVVEGASCPLPDGILNELKRIDFLFSPTEEVLSRTRALESVLLSACPASATLATLAHLNAQLHGRSYNEIPDIEELGKVYFPSVESFYSSNTLIEIMKSPISHQLLSASRKLATTLRAVIAMRPDVVYNCALAHRHVAATRVLVEKFPGELEMSDRLIPFGERLRDLGISRKLCGVETAATIAALTRSFVQIAAGHLNCDQSRVDVEHFRALLDVIDSYKVGENSLRLHAMISPLFDVLQSLSGVLTRSKWESAPRSIIKPKELILQGHIPGFACEQRPEVSESCEEEDDDRGPVDRCEIAEVVTAFEGLTDVKKVDNLRRPWLFLQSINANWHDKLRESGWGFKVSHALENLSKKAREADMKPRRNPKHCRDKETSEFLDWVDNVYLKKTDLETAEASEAFARALRGVANVNPDCSVALSVAYMTAMDVISSVMSKPVCYPEIGQISLFSQATRDDLATVTEIVWQTIAGEKLSDLLAHRGGLFQLMRRYWAILVSICFVMNSCN